MDSSTVAPTLIFHYVQRHHYRPPQAFVTALLRGPAPPDPAYFARLQQLGLTARMFVARLGFALILTSTVISVGVARADFRCEPTCYPGAPRPPQCDGANIVCEGSGNKAVLAVNLIAYRLMEAIIARQGQDPKACRAAVQAAHNTRLAVAQLRDELRGTGDLGSGTRYLTAHGKVFDESELLRLIDSGEDDVYLTGGRSRTMDGAGSQPAPACAAGSSDCNGVRSILPFGWTGELGLLNSARAAAGDGGHRYHHVGVEN